ncbi:MAG: Major facilitator superfamily 1 transporter, partial [Modestobacter sp.]|nr:Major facilitator superfamily 1 transporter [Modestobacter sp.]
MVCVTPTAGPHADEVDDPRSTAVWNHGHPGGSPDVTRLHCPPVAVPTVTVLVRRAPSAALGMPSVTRLTSVGPDVDVPTKGRSMAGTYQQAPAQERHRLPVRTLVSASIGNAVEWFDWTVYATFLVYFSTQFFPKDNEALALIGTTSAYALA